MVDPTPLHHLPEKLMDLSVWIERYCLDADGVHIKLHPWQKALLLKMQESADKKIALRKARHG